MGLCMFDRLCIKDAAKRLGVSTDTIRRRIRSREISAQQDNARQWWVMLPADGVPNAPAEPAEEHEPALGMPKRLHALGTVGTPNADSEGIVQELHKAYATAFDRLERAHSAAMAMMTERVDAAECRAERVEEQLGRVLESLIESSRPWWSRWLGASKRSDLG